MTIFPRSALATMVSLLAVAPAMATEDYDAPYRRLQEANRTLDAALATSAYAPDGLLIFDVPGQRREVYRGSSAIRSAGACCC